MLALPDAVFDFASFWGGFGLGDGVRSPAEGVPVCVVVEVALVVVSFGCWDLVKVLSHFARDPMLEFVPGEDISWVSFPFPVCFSCFFGQFGRTLVLPSGFLQGTFCFGV